MNLVNQLVFIRKSLSCFGCKGGIQFAFDYYKNRIFYNRKHNCREKTLNFRGNILHYRSFSSDVALIRSIIIDGEYDIDFKDKKFDIIFDLGANIGLFSLLYAQRFPDVNIVAVEPDPRNYNFLTKNTKNIPSIKRMKAGIWWRDASLSLRDTGSFYGVQVIEAEKESTNNVKGVSIDSLLNKYDDRIKALIKMDIEGSERVLFEHIEETSWIKKCDCLVMEIHGDKESKLFKNIHTEMNIRGFSNSSRGENEIFMKRET